MLNILRRSNSDGRNPFWLTLRRGSDSACTTGDAWEAEKLPSQSSPEKGSVMEGRVFTSSAAGGSFCAARKKHLVCLAHQSLQGSTGNQGSASLPGLGACGLYPSTLCTISPARKEAQHQEGSGLGDLKHPLWAPSHLIPTCKHG